MPYVYSVSNQSQQALPVQAEFCIPEAWGLLGTVVLSNAEVPSGMLITVELLVRMPLANDAKENALCTRHKERIHDIDGMTLQYYSCTSLVLSSPNM